MEWVVWIVTPFACALCAALHLIRVHNDLQRKRFNDIINVIVPAFIRWLAKASDPRRDDGSKNVETGK